MTAASACDECLARSWLLGRLAPHLDIERERIAALLDLGEEDLISAVAGRDATGIRGERRAFDAGAYRERCAEAGLALICRCDPGYPSPLWALSAEPAVLHVAGGLARFLALAAGEGVAIVGARRASPYALEIARSLARGVGRAGATVISGMAAGVDAAAHEGALDARGATVAVLPAAPQRPYPASERRRHQRIIGAGAVVSELGPDVAVRRWMFPARNRLIAALGAMTVVVAARRRSGALLTAGLAQQLGRPVGAVPGQVTAPLSWGPHELVKHGARLVTEPADILEVLFGSDGAPLAVEPGAAPAPELRALFDALADGHDPPQAFEQAGLDTVRGLAALAALELGGFVHRRPGGRFSIAT